MLIFLVVITNALAAMGLQYIIRNLDSLGLLVGFLISLGVYVVAGIGMVLKDKAEIGGIYILGVFLATLATFGLLSPALKPYMELWNTSTTFWAKALLVWLALEALTLVWVALKKPNE